MQKRTVAAAITFVSSLCMIAAIVFLVPFRTETEDGIASVGTLGHIAVGGKAIVGRGSYTFAPHHAIPPAKFYVTVIDRDIWCSNEDCSLDGALIQTMGGWLQAEKTGAGSEIREEIGLDLPENKEIKTLVIVSDGDSRIAGIYPHHGLSDVLLILRLHPDLADFSFLEGVQEFGALKVGQPAPLRPGDSLTRFGNTPIRYGILHIPTDKKFYLFSVQKRKYDTFGGHAPYDSEPPSKNKFICYLSGCRYPEPDPPHDFLFAHVKDLGGWFFSNEQDKADMPPFFGMSQEAVLAGTSSLVVLTDSQGTIMALHPGKTLSDALTILSQHPEIADVKELYRR